MIALVKGLYATMKSGVYTFYYMRKLSKLQLGYERAAYGKKLLKALSEKLCLKYDEGWSYSNLRQIRQFYCKRLRVYTLHNKKAVTAD